MLKQIKVAVKTLNGQCDTLCTECATVRAVTQRVMTTNLSGIIYGSVVPRALDGQSIWTEGCQCYVNFEYDDDQVAGGVILRPCDICLVCGCVVDLIDRVAVGTGWQGFDPEIVFPGTQNAYIVDQAEYNADGGNVFFNLDFRTTLSGALGGAVAITPPVPGIPDNAQSGYIIGGVVTGVEHLLGWRYDAANGGKIIIFMPDAGGANIPNGVFEAHIRSFYKRAP